MKSILKTMLFARMLADIDSGFWDIPRSIKSDGQSMREFAAHKMKHKAKKRRKS